MKQIVAVVLGVFLAAQSAGSWAGTRSEESTLEQISYGTGSVIGSAIYFPFKATFCILGGIGGGFTLIFSDRQTASQVVDTTCRGTWAITPDALKGQEQVNFIGERPEAPAPYPASGQLSPAQGYASGATDLPALPPKD